MAGLTDKQAQFVHEYLIDLNATQACIRAGYSLPDTRKGYYVYILLDGERVFYVGKGKGARVEKHLCDSRSTETVNQVKAEAIRCAQAQGTFATAIFADNLDEPTALSIERAFIHELRQSGLTNIASGIVHPIEAQIARVEANIKAIVPFRIWEKQAPEHARAFAMAEFGSLQGFYDWFEQAWADLRGLLVSELESMV